MGAGPSKPSATSGSSGVGKFQLTEPEYKQERILSYLFQGLLKKNNLLELASLVSSTDKCDKLITVLSSQINKEFQTLRFPDRDNPAKLQVASFISEEDYAELKKKETMKYVCDYIATFLLQFVILISALTTSVSIPPGTPRMEEGGVDIVKLKENIFFQNIQKDIQEVFDSGSFRTVSKVQTRPLWKVNTQYYLNELGILYTGNDRTKLLGVTFQYYIDSIKEFRKDTPEEYAKRKEEEQRLQERQYAAYSYPPRQAAYPGPAGPLGPMPPAPAGPLGPTPAPAFPTFPASSAPPMGGSKKRKSRKQQRRMRGGNNINVTNVTNATNTNVGTPGASAIPASPSGMPTFPEKRYYLISLYDYLGCPTKTPQGCSPLAEFAFDREGHFWDKTFFLNSISGGVLSTESAMDFVKILQTTSAKISEERKVETQTIRITSSGMDVTADFSGNEATLQYLQSIQKSIGDNSFLAPAVQRAYMLATNVPVEHPGAVQTTFCRDPWSTLKLQSVPAYAMFEALFIEKDSTEKQNLLQKFQAQKLIASTNQNSYGATGSFASYIFPKITETGVVAFCGLAEQYTKVAEQKQILLTAYKQLQGLYSAHLQAVFEFLKTILVVDQDFLTGIQSEQIDFTKPILRLHPSFFAHPAGSRIALLEKIRVARQLLTRHYYQVEMTYTTAISNFGLAAQGRLPPAPAK